MPFLFSFFNFLFVIVKICCSLTTRTASWLECPQKLLVAASRDRVDAGIHNGDG